MSEALGVAAHAVLEEHTGTCCSHTAHGTGQHMRLRGDGQRKMRGRVYLSVVGVGVQAFVVVTRGADRRALSAHLSKGRDNPPKRVRQTRPSAKEAKLGPHTHTCVFSPWQLLHSASL
jgi:hypothetical protein